jgi:DNA-binding MarR family transcriptional regulator
MSKRKSEKAARHVRLYHYMLQTEAWKSLGVTERAMYIDIASRYAGLGSNNGRIHYSVRDAAENLNISRSTASRGLTTLQERGFLVAERRGAFSIKTARKATEYRLTEFASDINSDVATKEFMRWKPSEKQNTVTPAGPCGYSGGTVRLLRRDHA